MNDVFAFIGPTFPGFSHSKIVVLPPARRGDIFKAIKAGPRTILLVDGYFGQEAAVMHREILYAIQLGIRVVGCSSMGALRAAELHTHGMQGIGKIFAAFRDGDITGDDEVALLHGPPELAYCQITLPLINLRSTAEFASKRFPLMETLFAQVVEVAANIPFCDRSFEEITRILVEHKNCQSAIHAIPFLRRLWIDQKRADLRGAVHFICSRADDHVNYVPQKKFVETSWLRLQRTSSEPDFAENNAKVFEALIRFYDERFREYLLRAFIDKVLERFRANIEKLDSNDFGFSAKCIREYVKRWPNASRLDAVGACIFLSPDELYENWLDANPRKIKVGALLAWAASNQTVVDKAFDQYCEYEAKDALEFISPNLGAMNKRNFGASSDLHYKSSYAELGVAVLRSRPWATTLQEVATHFVFHSIYEMLDVYRHVALIENFALMHKVEPWWSGTKGCTKPFEKIYSVMKDIIK